MKKVLKRFGKYLLLDRLAQGGMAEIFRAWTPSMDGGGRLVVLKCVQQDYGQDPEFIQMFRSEIRVTMGLNHPNIVQLYDFGEVENQPFIAMELVDGKSLKQLTTRLANRKEQLAPEYAAHLISQAAAGFHYAHTFRDRSTGLPLNIIHRDVSPQNLLISYDGNIKIIDFGIAKAADNKQSTRAGIIKGKPSYLSPEQIDGAQLDARSDIFSLGTVLWEALTGQKLFAGNTDLEAIRLIEDCDKTVKAPSKLNTAVPPELDAIVFKALAKNREQRFKTAEEMQRALHRFVYQCAPDFDPSVFAKYFQSLFRSEIDEEQRTIRQLNTEAKELFSQLENSPGTPAQSAPKTSRGADIKAEKSSVFTGFTLESVPIDLQTMPNIKAPEPEANRERRRTPERPSRSNKAGSAGPARLALPLIVVAAGIYFLLPVLKNMNEAKHPVHKTEQKPPASTLAIELTPVGGAQRVFINSQPVDPYQVRIAPGTTVKLTIVKDGFKPIEQDITGKADASPIHIQAVMDPVSFGSLTLYTTPSADAKITTGDLVWIRKTPIEGLKLPPGQYQITLSNSLLGMEKQITVQIQADKLVTRELNLDINGQ